MSARSPSTDPHRRTVSLQHWIAALAYRRGTGVQVQDVDVGRNRRGWAQSSQGLAAPRRARRARRRVAGRRPHRGRCTVRSLPGGDPDRAEQARVGGLRGGSVVAAPRAVERCVARAVSLDGSGGRPLFRAGHSPVTGLPRREPANRTPSGDRARLPISPAGSACSRVGRRTEAGHRAVGDEPRRRVPGVTGSGSPLTESERGVRARPAVNPSRNTGSSVVLRRAAIEGPGVGAVSHDRGVDGRVLPEPPGHRAPPWSTGTGRPAAPGQRAGSPGPAGRAAQGSPAPLESRTTAPSPPRPAGTPQPCNRSARPGRRGPCHRGGAWA